MKCCTITLGFVLLDSKLHGFRYLSMEPTQEPVCSQMLRACYLEQVFIIDLKGFQNWFPGLQPAQKSWSFCFEEPSTCSLSTLSQKLHVFVRGRVNKIVWRPCKLTTLEWKLHVFFRVILYELKAPHFCSKFVQSSTENDFTSLELHRNAQKSRDLMFASLKLRTLCLHVLQFHRKKQWYCILSSLLSRKLTHLWGSELEASHICSKFVKSSRKRYLLRPELHKNRPHANLLNTLQANHVRMEAPLFFQGDCLRAQSSTLYVYKYWKYVVFL
jgi:hypothetical protein